MRNPLTHNPWFGSSFNGSTASLLSRSITKSSEVYWRLLRLQLPYVHLVISLIIQLIGVDKEVPLFRRSAALVKLVLPNVLFLQAGLEETRN